METEDTAESSDMSNSIFVTETLWRALNNPLITIFSDLDNPGTEHTLKLLLDSMLRSSCNLVIVLLPPFDSGGNYENLRMQHTAYTTWLFGILFHVVGAPLSELVLNKSVQVQACMLRILARLDVLMFNLISSEYMRIFDELLDWSKNKEEDAPKTFEKFIVDRNAIENLDLPHFPVTIEASRISVTQISIMNIIMKTGVSCFDEAEIWNRIHRVMEISEPEAKLVAIKVASEIIEFCTVDAKDSKIFVTRATEVMKTLETWRNFGILNGKQIQKLGEEIVGLLNNVDESTEVTELCFAIVNLIAEKVIDSEQLEKAACEKICKYLTKNPRVCKSCEIKTFLRYFENCPEFSRVIVHFVMFDVKKRVGNNEELRITDVSQLWRSLKTIFDESMETERFDRVFKIISVSRSLSRWLNEERNVRGILYNENDALIREKLVENLGKMNCREIRTIYDCLIDFMAHGETEKTEIERILSLPWSMDSVTSAEGSRRLLAVAKSLDPTTKAKALRSIVEFGNGRERFKYLSALVSSTEFELSRAAITSSVLLLRNSDVTILDVNTHVLRTALQSQSQKAQEALASVLGEIVCFVSGNAKFKRVNWESNDWRIECAVCDQKNIEEFPLKNSSRDEKPAGKQKMTSEVEKMMIQYLKLLSSNVEAVRKKMSENLHRFSNHIEDFGSKRVSKLWLPLMRDSSETIRNIFSSAIGTIVKNALNSLKSKEESEKSSQTENREMNEFLNVVVNFMAETLEYSLETPDDSLHCTIIATATEFSRLTLHNVERQLATIFFITIMHANSSNTAVASACIAYREMSAFYKITPKEMYCRYKKDFLELMMRMSVNNYIEKSFNIATSLHRIAKCIGYQGSQHLLRKDGNLAICYLISLIVTAPAATNLIHDMSELMMMDERDMFTEFFQHICAHIFLNEPPERGTKCFRLISDVTRIKLGDLMTVWFLAIFRELLLHFHEKMETVVKCLQVLSYFDGKPAVSFESNEDVANYLKPNLHAVLVHLDSNLSPGMDEYTQKSALASLGTLMRFMGPENLAPLRYKILATLRVSLSFVRPGFPELACYAWDSFLRNISLEDLGPLLPTICVSIIPLLESRPREAREMLEYLLVERIEATASHISELFFIEDIILPRNISNIVKNARKRTQTESVEANLKLWLRRITHETDEIRSKALIHLKKYLGKHRSELNEMILANTDAHPLIVELLDGLLAGCQDKDEEIRLGSGECLGELGAVEPSLLPRRIIARDDCKFIAETNEEFAHATLIELVRDFQMQKSTQSMDCFSLAIQEILKTYEITPMGKNSELWNDLPSRTRQIIFPFLTSHYKIMTNNDGKFPHPIYGSEAGSTFQKWAYNWVSSMSSCVKDANLRTMLNASRPAFKRDTRTMIFCIPYIVSYIAIKGTEREKDRVIKEILAVIKVEQASRLDDELSRRRPLRSERDEKPSETRVSDEERRLRCSQVIFSTVDYLQRWLSERRPKNEEYREMENFFGKLDSLVLAQGCYQSHEYHRALMYLERHMASTNKGLSELTEGGLLAKIYTQLEEPDGVSGILATQNHSPTLQQLVLAHEVSGQLQDAATCYERLAQRAITPKYLQGMIQCYLGLDQPFTAMNIAKGILESSPELEPLIVEHEPFWQLAHFPTTEEEAPRRSNVKRILLEDLKKGRIPDLRATKKRLVSLLGAASHPGAYQQSYPHIMKLHVLNEFEKAASRMIDNVDNLPEIFDEWNERGRLIRPSRGVEFVLGMRRATLDLAVQLQKETNNEEHLPLQREIGLIWLKSAKIARKAGLYQQAYMYILSASDSCPPQELYIEQAQLYWQKTCQEEAFVTLKRCFANCFQPTQHYKDMPIEECTEERRQCAKAKLLFAKYNDETLNVDTDVNIANYKAAIEVWRGWEKSLLACAQYYESIVDRMSEDDKDTKGRELQAHMINYYGKSLQYGCKYVHQSMPRMLTIWLDFSSRVQNNRSSANVRVETMLKMTKIIDVYLERLPIFMWLTAFSQLVSRICHPGREVQNTLSKILVKLILAYPQHCLWMMASVFNSSYPAREKRCREILSNSRLETAAMKKLITDFDRFWGKLIELSNKSIPDGTLTTSVKFLSSDLPRLLASSNFEHIMMPTTKFLQLHLPSKGESTQNYDPFPTEWVYITGIDESVMVMTSLQRPRRIKLRGSDGKFYLFMCKPKDDLRRDFRLMEFNGIVNKYLKKDPESRQRRLYIRTYSVVPLNEECGLIEWVPNLVGFRPVVNGIYKERGIAVSNRDLKPLICGLRDSLEKKRHMFVEKLLPKHPPVFGDWFRFTFPDPYGWYEARTAYIRTTAVMSMVGYILGLGDRHGENILFDSKCGDCVHVDFNCLFNRGEQFEWPERVPFRLTQNMLDAMGPLKYEGPFRRSCQTTMRVLREQASVLVSVLTPFVYDPLVTWSKNQPGSSAEKTNEKAVEHIKNIEQRLNGLMRPQGKKFENIALNLSVEGQTNHLILDATNVDNLCQMYFGWGAYL